MEQALKPRRGYNTREVRELIGNRSVATLYRWMDDPRYGFPKPKKVGASRTNIWDSVAVDAWLSTQLDKPAGVA
jgi:predicted DNA-binding transcriptional regulator AlpA